MAVKSQSVSWSYADFDPAVKLDPYPNRWIALRWPDIAGDGWCAVLVGSTLKAAAEANGIAETYQITVDETTGIPSTDVSGAASDRVWDCIYHGRATDLGAVELSVRARINRYVTASKANPAASRTMTGWWSTGLFEEG